MWKYTLRWWKKRPEKCLYSEFFWSVFSRFWTDYIGLWSAENAVQMRENMEQKNSEYGHILRSGNKNSSTWLYFSFTNFH